VDDEASSMRAEPVPANGGVRTPSELLEELSGEGSRLVRLEIALARAEMVEKARAAGLGAALVAGAAVGALLVLATATAASVLALALVLPDWAAALVVAGVWLAVAAALGAIGIKRLRSVPPPVPERAIATSTENVRWARSRLAGLKALRPF
jgi:Putative Actinobacterial Holin-X, holin superfamily III